MTGVSLPFGWFTKESVSDETKEILKLLKKKGVGSIELRSVKHSCDPEKVKLAAKRIWDEGFLITVHGAVRSLETAIEDVFRPLSRVLADLCQDSLTVTVHPIDGDNCALLTALSDHIINNDYKVLVALENNRLMPDKSEGDCAALVFDAVKRADRSNVGICFDMGHYMYYRKKNRPDDPRLLPGREFYKYVIHTHIHGVNGERTHFPLGIYELDLERILKRLSVGYFGVYNIELDLPRFEDIMTPYDAIECSVNYLEEKRHFCSRLYDTIRTDFDGWMESALKCLEYEGRGTMYSLIHSSSYLFKTSSVRWAMDISFRYARSLASSPKKARELFSSLDLMIISHGHPDHFEREVIEALSANDICFVIPDFLIDKAKEMGLKEDKMIIARTGERISFKCLEILPFKGKHFRPISGLGTEEYGYLITLEDSTSLVFPVDVRDYTLDDSLPCGDYCFCNVWLEDDSANEESWRGVIDDFSSFALSLSKKNIILTHLYENGRGDDKMWMRHHAEAIKEAVKEKSPETRVLIPHCGENILLS